MQMEIPPPVSDKGYPTALGAEVRSNYLRVGLAEETAYTDNFFTGVGGGSIAETTFSVLPSVAYDINTFRQHMTVASSPGFTFYSPSSALNEVDNSAAINYDCRVTPRTKFNVNDEFEDSSTSFGSTDAASNGVVSGAPESSTPGVTQPFAKRLTNSAGAEFSGQTGTNTMIGASGLSTVLHYPDPSQTAGLYDSSSRGGAVFYIHRITMAQYYGAYFQYLDMLAYPVGETSTTQTQTVMGYYTLYLKSQLSLSVSGGPQHYQTTLTPQPTITGWGPSVLASLGGQGKHISPAVSYSQSVTGGGGLLGAFHTRSAIASVRWQISRTWEVSAHGAYSINKSVSPILFSLTQSGHSVSGGSTLDYVINERMRVRAGYERLHQSYDNIPSIASNPDSDRETISLIWQFMRPLGR